MVGSHVKFSTFFIFQLHPRAKFIAQEAALVATRFLATYGDFFRNKFKISAARSAAKNFFLLAMVSWFFSFAEGI